MRARNREINIFNMSLLDILTGMLGAFLFLMVGLVPYYAKVLNSQLITPQERQQFDKLKKLLDKGLKGPLSPEEAQQLKDELARLQAANNQLRANNQQLQNQLAQTRQNLQTTTADRDNLQKKVKTLLYVTAWWGSNRADVDLFLIGPDGQVCGTKKEKLLGKKVIITGTDSNSGSTARNFEAVSIGLNNGGDPSKHYLLAYRVPAGAAVADYVGLDAMALVDDTVNDWFAYNRVGGPVNVGKSLPGKLYAWAFLNYDQKVGLTITLPGSTKLPAGVLPPPR
jgi:TolA-binding protein